MGNPNNEYYKLSWRERLGFCSGDLAQNLIYQTVSIWLLFYYNNVYGLDSATVAVMFLVVRVIDVIWDPMVGAMVDKHHPRWDGGYRKNFSRELWVMAVSMIRQIIDSARPRHTKFCIESMPWMIPSGPDEYLRLIEDVDRAEFGTHLDVVNMITSPRRYFYNDEFLEECFRKLHGTIVSCHLKDILLKQEYTFQLEECACGKGTLDIGLYARLATAENPRMPMIIEHLSTDEEYIESVKYVRENIAV